MKNRYTGFLFGISFLFLILISFGFVFAAHVVRTSSGGISYSVNEDVGFIYNITINNTDIGQNANITQINITLPSGFIFLESSQGTSQFGDFTNNSLSLYWINDTKYLINGSTNFTRFWFNATATNPGTYNLSITTTNSSGSFNSNITITVNDTTFPVINFGSGVSASGSYVNRSWIYVNVTVIDTYFKNVTIRLYNSGKTLNNSANSSLGTFENNFTSLTIDGIYFFNATSYDNSGNSNSTETRNITIDTINPSINNGSMNEMNNTILNRANIFVNVSSTDLNFANVTIRLYSSSLSLINSSNTTSGNYTYNFTGLSDVDGLYYFDSIAYDKAGNSNTTSLKQVILNLSLPLLSSSNTVSLTSTTATITYHSNKFVNATIAYGKTSSLGSTGTDLVNFSSSDSFTLSSLTESTAYYYNITICDRVRNCYTNGTNTFTTSEAVSTSSRGGTTTSTAYWTLTQSLTAKQFQAGYTKELGVKQRMKFNLGVVEHSAGVVAITSTTATINVSSTPQQAVFNIGDEKKFDVNDDKYYDVYIKLNSITNSKASIIVKSINETMPETTPAPVVTEEKKGVVQSVTDTVGEAGKTIADKASSLSWIWWIVIFILAIMIIVIIVAMIRGRKKDKYIVFKRTR